jgi:hypothetical protein
MITPKPMLMAAAGGLGAITVPIVLDVMHHQTVQGVFAYCFIFIAAFVNYMTGFKAGSSK